MSLKTYDAQTVSAAGAFLEGELERLDPRMHAPLVSVTWGRDIDLREDVSISDEATSFLNTSFAAPGANPTGKNWIGDATNVIPGISLGLKKTVLPLRPWGMELGYTIFELERAQVLGRPIDAQKLEGIRLKNQMDIDEMVYIGDVEMGATGLVNNAAVTPGSITSEWDADTTPEEMLDDINALIEATWQQAAYAVCPTHVLLPPLKFAALTKPVSAAGTVSILQYVAENSLSNRINGKPLEINPLKWLTGCGTANKDRMVAYAKGQEYVRYPLVPLQRTPLQYKGVSQICVYFGLLGEVEIVYPETVGYADGL